jgi:ABC-type sugar transport system substrate-binding protein
MLREQRRLVANWSYDEAYRQTENWLNRGGCVDAIWAANDDIALGAIDALEKAGRKPGRDVFVGGLNWSANGLYKVAEGQMTMTHGGHFFAGAWSIVLLHDYIQGIEMLSKHPEVTFRMEAITRENLPYFIDILGNRDWDSLDFRKFSIANSPSGAEYNFALHGGTPAHE